MLENLLLKLDLESSETSKARWKEVMTIFEEFFFKLKIDWTTFLLVHNGWKMKVWLKIISLSFVNGSGRQGQLIWCWPVVEIRALGFKIWPTMKSWHVRDEVAQTSNLICASHKRQSGRVTALLIIERFRVQSPLETVLSRQPAALMYWMSLLP